MFSYFRKKRKEQIREVVQECLAESGKEVVVQKTVVEEHHHRHYKKEEPRQDGSNLTDRPEMEGWS